MATGTGARREDLRTFSLAELVDMRDRMRDDPWHTPYPFSWIEDEIRIRLETKGAK